MDDLLSSLAALLLLGTTAQWIAWRLHLPGILLLLAFGFFAGPAWLGWIDADGMLGDLLFPVVSASVAVILFEGGLSLRAADLKQHGRVVLQLITVGALVTWVVSAVAGRVILQFDWSMAILFGAILIVSGPTVVLPLLHHIKPQGATRTILKWEGIAIDPVGAVLALLVFEGFNHGVFTATGHAALGIAKTLGFGTALGLAGGWLLVVFLRRYWIPDHLHNPVTLAMVVGVFAASNALQHESGLLAVTLMGIVAANQKDVSVQHILEFKENVRTLLISSLFVLLAARISPDDLAQLDWRAAAFLLSLLFVVRPLAVLASTRGSSLSRNERIFLAWMCPRGIVAAAVASVFGLKLVADGVPGADMLVPLTFVVIVGTVVVYGLTAGPLARRLGLATPNPQGILFVGAHSWSRDIAKACAEAGVQVLLVDTNRDNVRQARLEGMPAQTINLLADEHPFETLDLSGIGRLFALTANDQVNRLIAQRAVHEFGRSKTYVLAPDRMRKAESGGTADLRLLFGEDVDYYAISKRVGRGATVRTTGLTDQFGADDFTALHGERATPLLAVGTNGTVTVHTVDRPIQPVAGQTLIALVVPAPEEAPAPPVTGP